MGQRIAADFVRKFLSAAVILLCSCDRSSTPPAGSKSTTRESETITVASLVPAATDLLLGMGAGEHLVAVSNWDAPRPEIDKLPRVGDYRDIDWEKISQARPRVMIVQFRADKMPAGLSERSAQMNIRLVNVKINRLDDLFTTIDQLGEATNESTKAADAAKSLRARLDAVRNRVAGKTPVRTLITRSEGQTGLASVGGGNFLDDILTIAGGKNVLEGGDNSYPTIDREQLIALDPQAVFVLLPGESPQAIERSQAFWKSLSQLSAVRDGHVYVMTDPYLLLPGLSVGRIAEQFAEKLHPEAGTADKRR